MQTKHENKVDLSGVVSEESMKLANSGATFKFENDRLVKTAPNIGLSGLKAAEVSFIYPGPKMYKIEKDRIEMEFLEGYTPFPVWVANAPRKEVYKVVTAAFQGLTKYAPECHWMEVTSQIFIQKVRNIQIKAPGFLHSEVHNVIVHMLNMLDTIDFIDIPIGLCHGDLTLANIMVCSEAGQICYIDHLPCYVNSPWMDFAKMEQEIELGWSTLLLGKSSANYLAAISMMSGIIQYCSNAMDLDSVDYKIVKSINLLRLLPYCKDETIAAKITAQYNSLWS